MAKDFTFYAGAGAQPGIVADASRQRSAAEAEAARLRFEGAAQAANLIFAGLSQGLGRRHDAQQSDAARQLQALLAGQQEAGIEGRFGRELEFRRGERQAGQAFEAGQRSLELAAEDERRRREEATRTTLGQFEILSGLGRAAAEQGVPATSLMDRFRALMGANPRLQQATGAVPPGGPGGFMQEQPPATDPMYLALRQQGGGGEPQGFGDLRPAPKDANTVAALSELQAYDLSKDAKNLRVPVKKSRMWALRWDRLEPPEQDKLIQDHFPEARVQRDMEGNEDRSALDTYKKWLSEPVEEEVLNGPMIQQHIQNLAPKYGVKAVQEAILAHYGADADSPAMSMRQADEIVRERILKEMNLAGTRVRPGQVQGSADDVLGAFQAAKEDKALAGGASQPIPWTKATIEQLQLVYDNLPRELQSAADYGQWKLTPKSDGTFEIQGPDGAKPTKALKAAFENLAKGETGAAMTATSALGPEKKRTPSEMKDAATKVEMQGGLAPGQSRTQSALDRMRELFKKRAAGGKAAPKGGQDEAYWQRQRTQFLEGLPPGLPIVPGPGVEDSPLLQLLGGGVPRR